MPTRVPDSVRERHWRKEIAARDARRAATAGPLFVPAGVVPAPAPPALEVALSGGRVVRAPTGFDPVHLRVVVTALEEPPC